MGSREQENSICLGMGIFQEEKTSLLMLPLEFDKGGGLGVHLPLEMLPQAQSPDMPHVEIHFNWKTGHQLACIKCLYMYPPKTICKKNHVRLKSPYHVSNPELGSFSKRVLRLICLCSTGAIVIGCPSWHHQWPWWDSNSRLRNSYLAIMREIPGSIPALAILGSTLAHSNSI